jgi:hypothetical protein
MVHLYLNPFLDTLYLWGKEQSEYQYWSSFETMIIQLDKSAEEGWETDLGTAIQEEFGDLPGMDWFFANGTQMQIEGLKLIFYSNSVNDVLTRMEKTRDFIQLLRDGIQIDLELLTITDGVYEVDGENYIIPQNLIYNLNSTQKLMPDIWSTIQSNKQSIVQLLNVGTIIDGNNRNRSVWLNALYFSFDKHRGWPQTTKRISLNYPSGGVS